MVNTTAAIMAVPGPMDPIRLIGDEEKHATLLFFGETSTLPGEAKQTLLDSVELASTMLFPFGEAVVDVTRLGSEVPPALVALLDGENLNQVRNLFLMNPSVNDYRGNTDQFPGFTPHVTLSHPDFTDEVIQRALMRQVSRVRFDRLSVWWNDERFDFPLGPAQDNTSMADAVDRFAAQYALEDSDNLEHHGIKGQKWGVRKDSSAGGAKTAAVKEAVRRATGAALGINNNPRYKGKDLTKDPALKMQYDRDVKHAFQHELKVAAARTVVVAGVAAVAPAFPAAFTAVAAIAAHRIITTSSSSRIITGDFGVPSDAASSTFFMDSGLQHAAITGRTAYVLTADRDAKGFITKLFADELVVAHTDGAVDSVLEHAVKLGSKKGKPGHILFIARGSAPKVGSQFNHQGSPHQVIKVDTSSSDPKRHMVTAKKVDAKAVAHADLDEWETYLIEDDEDADYFEHHGIKGMKWGVRRSVDSATGRVEMTGSTGLKPRTGSADQIAQDRIQKKIDSVGVHALSTAELQSYSRRLQVEKDVNRVLAEQSAAQKAASQSFITKFVKKQAGRQASRVVDKALDVAVEKALHQAGINIGKKGGNPDAADLLVKTATRLAPKKGK